MDLTCVLMETKNNHYQYLYITLTVSYRNTFIINSYFPTDPKGSDIDTSDLLSTLSSVIVILENAELSTVVWIGESLADFLRIYKDH